MSKSKKYKINKVKPKKVKSLHELRIMTLRRASMRWKYKYEALNAAKIYVDSGTYKNGNVKTNVFFICAECQKQNKQHYYHGRTEVQVDHITEIAGDNGFTDWNSFIPALLCTVDQLQILCKPHHKEKTNAYLERRGLSKSKKINNKRKKTIDKK